MSKHSSVVKILPNTANSPAGKLPDAEVAFEADAGPLTHALNQIGFTVRNEAEAET